MGLFEFLMILISVVIGLGLGELLTGVANLLRVRETVRFYWIHVWFQFGIFIALVQQWWESWDLSSVNAISLTTVLGLLFPSVVLFLIAHLLYPKLDGETDLEAYYYRQAPVLWGLVVLATLEGGFLLPFLTGDPILQPANLSGIPMVVLCGVLAVSGSKRVHSVVAPFILVLVVLDTLMANPAISAP